jgi:L-malate glycosyltransferase
MSKIKVLHIIKSLGRGGAEMLLPETLKLHNKERFDFHYIYFLPWKDQMVDSIKLNGGKVTCIAAKNNVRLIMQVQKVVEYVRTEGIQVIHAHLPWAGILARFVGKLTGIPVLYTEHNKQERYHFATRFLNLATMNLATVVIPVSQDVKESLQKFKPSLKIPVETILNGVNVDHFAPEKVDRNVIRTQHNIPSEAIVIVTVAVFRFQKRLHLWLDTAKKILERHPNTHFIIVGDGPLKQEIEEKRKSLGIERNVHLVGLQTEVRPFLAAADIYMMSSIFEGLPIALLEAMAYGLPIISTNAGGIKEVVRDGVEGFLCDVNEPERLDGMALKLIADNQLRQSIGKAARLRTIESFSLQSMIKKLESLYASAARSH